MEGSKRKRERKRQRNGETVRQRDGKTERRRDGETERRRDGETERQRDRETERERSLSRNVIAKILKSFQLHEERDDITILPLATCYLSFNHRSLQYFVISPILNDLKKEKKLYAGKHSKVNNIHGGSRAKTSVVF